MIAFMSFGTVVLIVVVIALVAVLVDAIEDRDEHKGNAEQLARQLDVANGRLQETLDEHALCPAPYRTGGTW